MLDRIIAILPMLKFLDIYSYPECLYKYYNLNVTEYYEEILYRDTLYFTPPQKLNDPFDCSLDIKFSGKSKSYVKKYLTKHILPLQIRSVNRDLEKKANTFIDENYTAIDPNITKNESLLQQNTKDFVLASGVNCLTELKNNLLMWSHYSNKHTGFCVEFNCGELIKTIVNYNEYNKTNVYLNKVFYRRNYPSISAYKSDRMVDSLFTKSSIWMYEKEWRIFFAEAAGEKINLPPNVISSIYLGLDIKPDHEEMIKRIVLEKPYKIDLYRAKKVKNKFAICFSKIN